MEVMEWGSSTKEAVNFEILAKLSCMILNMSNCLLSLRREHMHTLMRTQAHTFWLCRSLPSHFGHKSYGLRYAVLWNRRQAPSSRPRPSVSLLRRGKGYPKRAYQTIKVRLSESSGLHSRHLITPRVPG